MQTKTIAFQQIPFGFRAPYDKKLSAALNDLCCRYPNTGVSSRKWFRSIQIKLNKKQLININPLLNDPRLSQPFKQMLITVYGQTCCIHDIEYLSLSGSLHNYCRSLISGSGSLFSMKRRYESFHNSQEHLKELHEELGLFIDSLQRLQERYQQNKQRALAKQFQKNIRILIKIQEIIDSLQIFPNTYSLQSFEKQAEIILRKLMWLRFSAKYSKPFEFIQEVLDTNTNAELLKADTHNNELSGVQHHATQNKPPDADAGAE
jgi:hypothetical protein